MRQGYLDLSIARLTWGVETRQSPLLGCFAQRDIKQVSVNFIRPMFIFK